MPLQQPHPFHPFANPTRNPTGDTMATPNNVQNYGYQTADFRRRQRTGMVGPIPSTGAVTSPEWEFVKTNKWYFIGGGLLLAAGVAYAMKHH